MIRRFWYRIYVEIEKEKGEKGRKREKRQGDFGTGYRDSEGKGTKDREIWVQDIKIEKEKGSKREKKGEKGTKREKKGDKDKD